MTKRKPPPPEISEQRAAFARTVIARQILAVWIARSEDDLAEMWEDYPDIPEDDWNAIVEEAIKWAVHLQPAEENYKRQYEVLAKRSREWEAKHA